MSFKVIRLLQAIFQMRFSYSHAAVDKILTDTAHRAVSMRLLNIVF